MDGTTVNTMPCRHRKLAVRSRALALIGVIAFLQPVSAALAQGVDVRPVKPVAPLVRPGQVGIRSLSGDQEIDLRAVRTAVVPPAVREIVAELDDSRWSIREAADQRLRTHPVSDEALLQVLDQDELSSEQRQRLLDIVAARVLLRERGAIGIRMNTRAGFAPGGVDGVEITEVIPGLPAERVLRVGDVITRIDEAPIRLTTDLISHVQRMPPGQVIDVRILRPRVLPAGEQPGPDWVKVEGGGWFEPVEVEFALGSYRKLGDPQVTTGNPETLRRLEYVRQLRILWDRAPVALDGRVTVDGVVPPEKSTPSGINRTIRRIGD